MYISPKYTLSDRLHAGVKLWFLLLIIGVGFGAIFTSVKAAELPFFRKSCSL